MGILICRLGIIAVFAAFVRGLFDINGMPPNYWETLCGLLIVFIVFENILSLLIEIKRMHGKNERARVQHDDD